jgi:hypothetical protein
MTPEQLHILQHSLGADKYGRNHEDVRGGPYYREHYCAGLENAEVMGDILYLVSQGWMVAGRKLNEGRDQFFHVTEAGIAAMLNASPQPPKLTRNQRRYRDYLRADVGDSFIEYLKYMHAAKRDGRIKSY